MPELSKLIPMKKSLFIVCLAWVGLSEALTVNIFSGFNGYGLEKDGLILKRAVESLGHKVNWVWNGDVGSGDVNIHFESMNMDRLDKAPRNWFVPNPDWMRDNVSNLWAVDLILCRTREVERIFTEMGQPTYFLGFSSLDCYLPKVKKYYDRCFHLGGGGGTRKGTNTLVRNWLPTFPLLKVIRHQDPPNPLPANVIWQSTYCPEEELRTLENQCGIHLCPSEVEGFGHYLVEGMSTKAVVITTDAPPMNEFIKDKRCLVPYSSTGQASLATAYGVDPLKLQQIVQNILQLPESEKRAIGEANRLTYLRQQKEFLERLKSLLDAI